MDCSVCLEDYNEEERVPKVLPCGHTVCLQCLRRLQQCPTCRRVFTGSPAEQPTNFCLLRLMRRQGDARLPGGWCLDCRAAAARRCLDEHAVLNARDAERMLKEQVPAGALQAALLPDVQCQGEQVLNALTLLSAPSWDLTLRAGGRQLNGTLGNTEDPLIKALWVAVASRAALTQSGAGGPAGEDPPPAAAALDPPPEAATLDPPPAAARPPAAALAPPPAEAPPPRELFVSSTSLLNDDHEKAAALQEVQGVVRLVGLRCRDLAWSLEMLRRAAPTVEQLALHKPLARLLRAALALPRLRRLSLWGAYDPLLSALPPGHSGLQWLRAESGIARANLDYLLQAHRDTLEELVLEVCEPGEPGWLRLRYWPHCHSDLPALLGGYGLRALRRLVLWRGCRSTGEGSTVCCRHIVCGEQLAAVRDALALPGVQVLCGKCERGP